MKEEPLHPWIEPELEARITALVLGEASDFEREELERLIEEKAELAMFRKRMEAVHGLLREVAAGEMGADDDDWKLSDERRQAVLAVIDGERREKVVEKTEVSEITVPAKVLLPKGKVDAKAIHPHKKESDKKQKTSAFTVAVLVHLGLAAILMVVVVYTPALHPPQLVATAYSPETDEQIEEVKLQKKALETTPSSASSTSLAISSMASSPIVIPEFDEAESVADVTSGLGGRGFGMSRSAPRTASTASGQVAKPDPMADSRSSLAAIQGNLDAYSNSPQESIPSSGSTSSVAVAGDKIEMPKVDRYLSADAGSGGVIRGVTGQAINGRVNLKDGTESLAANVDEDVSFEIAKLKERVSTRSPSQNPSFDSPPLPASSIVTPEFSQTETPDVTLEVVEEEMAKIPHFGENKPNLPAKRRNRVAGELAESDMALKKSIGDPFSESAPAAAAMDDKADGVSVSSLVSSQDSFADTQAVRKKDRDGEAKGAKLGADREEMLAARQLAEAQSPMARGQIAAADAPQPAPEEMAAGQGGVARKKEKAQAPSGLAPAAPAGARPAPAAAPMLAKKEELRGKGMKSSAEREMEGELDELSSKMLADRKQIDGNKRTDVLSQVKDQSEMKTSKLQVRGGQVLGEALTEDKAEIRAADKTTAAKPAQQLGRSGKEKAATKNAPNDPKEAIAGNKEEGFFLRGAKLNDVFTFLAKSAGLNYFHNPALEGSEYLVTGRLQEGGDPLSQMKELGLMYGVTFLQDGKTVQSLKAAEKKPAAPSGLDEKSADEEAFSTFSLHVSDVSFKLAQAALAKGEWPEASKVRIEEFVNAFDYGDPMPDQNEKVASRMEQAIHPFLQQRNLLRVSMRTAAAGRSGDTPLRLTLLLDNSGSMERIDRQETVRRAFALLAQQLKPIDQVTLISFARQPRLLADKVSGAQADQLVQLVANIPSEGGTNLEAALQLAFEKAREQKIDSAQNRVIMLTDGAANLGDAEPDSLAQMIETMRDAGIAFDAAGIGAEGLNDEILEALTRKGDGRYYLLDQPEDADEGFARQIAGALRPAAKNVKVQVEFNPERVGKYKLLGFEKHLLKKEDFRNDKVDAAEMAAAEAGVAVYQFEAKPDGRGDVGSVSVRFLDMSSGQMVEKRWPIPYQADAPRLDEAAPSLRIAATSALLAAKLKGEALGQSVDLKTLSNYTAGLPDRYRNAQRVQQLQEMINQARAASR
jgi:hypothetical protein